MSTSAPIGIDEFQALEQKVLRAVEIVRHERDARAAAQAEIAQLQQKIAAQAGELEQQRAEFATERDAHAAEIGAQAAELDRRTSTSQAQISAFEQERQEVRQRVEKMLGQMDELL